MTQPHSFRIDISILVLKESLQEKKKIKLWAKKLSRHNLQLQEGLSHFWSKYSLVPCILQTVCDKVFSCSIFKLGNFLLKYLFLIYKVP